MKPSIYPRNMSQDNSTGLLKMNPRRYLYWIRDLGEVEITDDKITWITTRLDGCKGWNTTAFAIYCKAKKLAVHRMEDKIPGAGPLEHICSTGRWMGHVNQIPLREQPHDIP